MTFVEMFVCLLFDEKALEKNKEYKKKRNGEKSFKIFCVFIFFNL
jgi:hypothetical protein